MKSCCTIFIILFMLNRIGYVSTVAKSKYNKGLQVGLYANVEKIGEVREEKRTVSLQPAYA